MTEPSQPQPEPRKPWEAWPDPNDVVKAEERAIRSQTLGARVLDSLSGRTTIRIGKAIVESQRLSEEQERVRTALGVLEELKEQPSPLSDFAHQEGWKERTLAKLHEQPGPALIVDTQTNEAGEVIGYSIVGAENPRDIDITIMTRHKKKGGAATVEPSIRLVAEANRRGEVKQMQLKKEQLDLLENHPHLSNTQRLVTGIIEFTKFSNPNFDTSPPGEPQAAL